MYRSWRKSIYSKLVNYSAIICKSKLGAPDEYIKSEDIIYKGKTLDSLTM